MFKKKRENIKKTFKEQGSEKEREKDKKEGNRDREGNRDGAFADLR